MGGKQEGKPKSDPWKIPLKNGQVLPDCCVAGFRSVEVVCPDMDAKSNHGWMGLRRDSAGWPCPSAERQAAVRPGLAGDGCKRGPERQGPLGVDIPALYCTDAECIRPGLTYK